MAALAFLLLPTGHSGSSFIVSVNGLVVSAPPSAGIDEVADDVLALARSGSEFDITGDVIGLGEGSPGAITMNGSQVDGGAAFTDGAQVLVSHGSSRLEPIKSKEKEIPFETVVEGDGIIVSLTQVGNPGRQELVVGEQSGRQAAVFTIEPARNTVIERSNSVQSGQKLAALTFDDGPDRYTQGVLDALAAAKVPATFFVLGGNAVGHADVIANIKAAGHELGNHSWSHSILTQVSEEQLRSEIARTSDLLGGTHLLRPPYGTYDARVAAVAGSLGHTIVNWNVDTLDWKSRDADAILAKVKQQTRPGAIILMHDGGKDRSQTVAAIPRVVDWLLFNGYSLTTVSKLLKG